MISSAENPVEMTGEQPPPFRSRRGFWRALQFVEESLLVLGQCFVVGAGHRPLLVQYLFALVQAW